jgi:hypothetical protein
MYNLSMNLSPAIAPATSITLISNLPDDSASIVIGIIANKITLPNSFNDSIKAFFRHKHHLLSILSKNADNKSFAE